jgi:alkyl sulfatase BDS1-like metallo-beta-lactamase superfamily hydrolase
VYLTGACELRNGAQGMASDPADATVHLTRERKVEGSRLKLLSFLSLIDKPDGRFAIVTP